MRQVGAIRKATNAATVMTIRTLEQRIIKLEKLLATLARNNQLAISYDDLPDDSGIAPVADLTAHEADASIHFTEASIDHTAITNIGSNAHSVIDTHLGSTTNPHSVTDTQVLPAQAGESGKYLTTNGTAASWGAVSTAYVPLYEQSAEPSDPGGFAFWRDTDDNSVSYWSEGNSRWQRLL